ncbi:MAG: ATP synthase F0 subunit B [Bdellovibrionales bacterium]|nr:ATP synthase F0 subunit B [Bdellovibrionales bacterium]
MDLLNSLGIDNTLFYQLGIFLVGYVVLYNIVFKPYVAAHFERVRRTVGNMESNERVLADIQHLKVRHEKEARGLNEEYKSIYDKKRSEALSEYDKIVGHARDQSKSIIEDTRAKIQKEISQTKLNLEKEIPEVSQLLVAKLLK